MSKQPLNSQNLISVQFQNRLIKIMDDFDCAENNKKFASLAGVSQPVISRGVIYGIIPSVRILQKIADTLNISVSYLLGDTDKNDFFMAEPRSDFHTRLQELTEEKHTNYGAISQKMQFPRTYFYEWLKDKTYPSLDYLKNIAEYFEVSLDYLLGRTNIR